MSDRVSDAELVTKAEQGDVTAMNLLVERHYGTAVSAAFIVLKDMDASSDCAQDAFLEAAKTLCDIRSKDKFSQWIYGVSRRKAIYVLRRDKLLGKALKGKSDSTRSMKAEYSPPEQAGNKEKYESVRRAMNELPEIYREVLVLKYIDDRALEDIAELLDISVAAVDKRLMRGKAMLREPLKRWQNDD